MNFKLLTKRMYHKTWGSFSETLKTVLCPWKSWFSQPKGTNMLLGNKPEIPERRILRQHSLMGPWRHKGSIWSQKQWGRIPELLLVKGQHLLSTITRWSLNWWPKLNVQFLHSGLQLRSYLCTYMIYPNAAGQTLSSSNHKLWCISYLLRSSPSNQLSSE